MKNITLLILGLVLVGRLSFSQEIRPGDRLGTTDTGIFLLHEDGTWEKVGDDRLLDIITALSPPNEEKTTNETAASSTLEEEGYNFWKITTHVDPLYDTTSYILSNFESSGSYSVYDLPYLFVRILASGEVFVYINWDEYLGSDNTVPVTWRLDSSPAKTERWNASTTHDSSFYPGDTIAFLEKLSSSSKLVARVTRYDSTTLTAEFALSGLAKSLASIPLVSDKFTK